MQLHGAIDAVDGAVFDESVTATEGFETASARGVSVGSEFGVASETKSTQMDEVNAAEGEESSKFTIRFASHRLPVPKSYMYIRIHVL